MYLSYEQLREKLAAGDKYDLAVIDRAYQLAYDAHGEQKRRSGEPYITSSMLSFKPDKAQKSCAVDQPRIAT